MNERRLLGAYYTPENLTSILARWALTGLHGNVLDPSYGGCAFLTAAADVLEESGVPNAGSRIFGVDIDKACTDHVKRHGSLIAENCITADFLQLSPDTLDGSPFGAIVGNPPFVRHHWIKNEQRESARAVGTRTDVQIPATASLWAYFLLHSLDFLADGGRLAMLVPEAMLQTDYAAPLRRALASRFEATLLVHIRQRLFANTDEAVVVVASSGFGGSGNIREEAVEDVDELASMLTPGNDPSGTHDRSLVGRFLDRDTRASLEKVWSDDSTRRLSAVARVRIGIVTGANSYFIRSQEDLDALGIPDTAHQPIVARTRWLTGLEFTGSDHRAFVNRGARAFLIRPPDREGAEALQRWIDEGIAEEIDQRHHCLRRSEWFRIDLPSPPGAFSTCTRVGSPLLVINRAGYHCSNALHSVSLRQASTPMLRQMAVAFLTSPVALWSELHGRRYGGGILKLEPGALKQMPIPLIDGVEDTFDDVDELLRSGEEETARQHADEHVLRGALEFTPAEIQNLQEVREKLMTWRQPSAAGMPDAEVHGRYAPVSRTRRTLGRPQFHGSDRVDQELL